MSSHDVLHRTHKAHDLHAVTTLSSSATAQALLARARILYGMTPAQAVARILAGTIATRLDAVYDLSAQSEEMSQRQVTKVVTWPARRPRSSRNSAK